MALTIKNREVENLARELARISGKSITEAVRDSLRRELDRVNAIADARRKADAIERMMALGRQVSALPNLTDMTDEEILGYDEFGAPTR